MFTPVYQAGRPVPPEWLAHQAIRDLEGYEAGAYVVPSPASQIVPSHLVQQTRLALRPGSYVLGFSGSSQQPEGFSVQIRDLATNATFFSSFADWMNITSPAPEVLGIDFPMVLLPAPRIVTAPGVLSVQIRNNSGASNLIELVVFVAEPQL